MGWQEGIWGFGRLALIPRAVFGGYRYVDTIPVEINDLLIESGQVSLAELCKRFNLPSDFLLSQLEPWIWERNRPFEEESLSRLWPKSLLLRFPTPPYGPT